MVNVLFLATSVLAQEELVGDLQNFLARVARNVVRLSNGHETLIVTILVLLLVMYLYIRKA